MCKDEIETAVDFVHETLECPSCVAKSLSQKKVTIAVFAKSLSHKSELEDAKLNGVTIAVFGTSSLLWCDRGLMVGSNEVNL